MTVLPEPLDHRVIDIKPIALADHLSIPLKPVGLQRPENRRLSAWHFTRRIEVLHAQQPTTTHGTGVEIGSEGGNQRAEVQVTTGGRREAAYIRRGCGHEPARIKGVEAG